MISSLTFLSWSPILTRSRLLLISDVPWIPATFKSTGCPVRFNVFIRLSSTKDMLAPELHKANVFRVSLPLPIVTGMTGSTPLLFIDDRLETSSTFSTTFFCSTFLYGLCSNLWWGFPQPFTSHSLPEQFLIWCASDKHFEHSFSSFAFCPRSSTFIFLNFSHFHIWCWPSFNTLSRWVFELSFAVFVADVANVEPSAFSL